MPRPPDAAAKEMRRTRAQMDDDGLNRQEAARRVAEAATEVKELRWGSREELLEAPVPTGQLHDGAAVHESRDGRLWVLRTEAGGIIADPTKRGYGAYQVVTEPYKKAVWWDELDGEAVRNLEVAAKKEAATKADVDASAQYVRELIAKTKKVPVVPTDKEPGIGFQAATLDWCDELKVEVGANVREVGEVGDKVVLIEAPTEAELIAAARKGVLRKAPRYAEKHIAGHDGRVQLLAHLLIQLDGLGRYWARTGGKRPAAHIGSGPANRLAPGGLWLP